MPPRVDPLNITQHPLSIGQDFDWLRLSIFKSPDL